MKAIKSIRRRECRGGNKRTKRKREAMITIDVSFSFVCMVVWKESKKLEEISIS